MAQIAYIDQLPSITEGMIRMLPSYTVSAPISLSDFMAIRTPNQRNVNMRVGDIITKIQDNIRLIKKSEDRKKLEELLETQLAIIQHGYEGVCTSAEATVYMIANMKESIANGYKPRFEV